MLYTDALIVTELMCLDTAYPLPSDTAYRTFCPIQRIHSTGSYGVFTSIEYSIVIIRAGRLKKELQEIVFEGMDKAHNESNPSITSNDITIELNKEFLDKLRKNTYYETYNEDVVEHIAKSHKKVDGRTQKVIFHSWMNGNWNKRYMDNGISSNNEWKESKYEKPPNNTSNSFFEAYDVHDIEKEKGQGQMKRKNDNNNDVQPHIKICKTEKFEAI
ncbi:hypothetical protein Tco_0913653 [Tanacetum coccineum]